MLEVALPLPVSAFSADLLASNELYLVCIHEEKINIKIAGMPRAC